jgi:hypothetical protein
MFKRMRPGEGSSATKKGFQFSAVLSSSIFHVRRLHVRRLQVGRLSTEN